MSLFKKLSLFSLVLISTFSFVLVSFAESTEVVTKTEPASCFDYYKFQSVQVSVGPDKQILNAGESAIFRGELINENNYPVVDGYVFVRIGEKNPEYITEGQFIVDEFFALEKVTLNANEKKPISFTWTPPKNLKAGDYRADYFFSVGKKFNLGGLPFTNEVIIGFADFKVDSAITTGVAFDKSSTKVNDAKYNHIGAWPNLKEGEKAVIGQNIKNTSAVKKTVSVQYDLFYWDSLNETDKIDSKKESITLEAKSQKEFSYTIPKITRSVYYLRITALSSDGQKSIVNIRVASDLESPRINYPAINKFPLKAGEDFTLFSCYHNTSYIDTEGEVKVFLTDDKGKSIGELSYKGVIPSAMSAQKVDLKALKDLFTVNLKAEVYNKAGVLVDKYETRYSCDNLNSDKCPVAGAGSDFGFVAVMIILGAILILIILILLIKNKKHQDLSITMIILLAVSLVSGFGMASMIIPNQIQAETVSEDGKTKSQTSSYSYRGAFDYGTKSNTTTDWDGIFSQGNIDVTNTVTLNGETSLNINNTVSFSKNLACFYYNTGSNIDTPNCGVAETMIYSSGNGYGIKWSAPSTPSMTLTSSNTGVMTCSGASCTAVGSGVATVTATIAGVSSTVDLNYYSTNQDLWYCNRGVSLIAGKTCSTYRLVGLVRADNVLDRTFNTKTFPAYAPTWTFTVASTTTSEPPAASSTALTVSCSANPNPATVNQSMTWTANSTGGTGSYTYSWTGRNPNGMTWTAGNVSSVTRTYTSTGTTTATTTVTSGTASTTVSCPGAVTAGGSRTGGGGVSVNDPVKQNGECVVGGSYPTKPADPYLCIVGDDMGVGTNPDGSWFWRCNGINDGFPSGLCSATKTLANIDQNLNCDVSMTNPASSPVNVNTNTTWSVNVASLCPTCLKTWSFNSAATTTSTDNILNKIFTTVGLKTVSVQVSSTTAGTIGNPCTATVNVVQTGGNTREI